VNTIKLGGAVSITIRLVEIGCVRIMRQRLRKIEALYMNYDPRTATSDPDQTTLMDGFNGRH